MKLNRGGLSFFFILAASIMVFSGCQTTKGTVTIKHLNDPMERVVKVSTLGFQPIRPPWPGLYDAFYIGQIAKDGRVEPSYSMYVQIRSDGWRYWDQARYLDGDNLVDLAVRPIGKDVSCSGGSCTHFEDISIKLTREILEEWAKEGATIRITSSKVDDKRDISMDANQSKAFIEAINKTQQQLNTAAQAK